MLPLATFDQHLDGKILGRGRAYFDEGAVYRIELTATGYSVGVRGTDDYTVRLDVAEGRASNWSCDCPYAFGDTCKHVVAALYAVAEFEGSGAADAARLERRQARDRLRETLAATNKDTLIDGLLALADDDARLRDRLALRFAPPDEDEGLPYLLARLRTVVERTVGKRDFTHYRAAHELYDALQPFREQLVTLVGRARTLEAFHLAVALIEEATFQYERLDDSSGYLGAIVAEGIEALEGLVATPLPAPVRTAMLDALVRTVEHGDFLHWDWHLAAAQLAGTLVASREEADALVAALGSPTNDYIAQHTEALELDLLRRFGSGADVDAFVEAHVASPDVRRGEVEQAFAKADFARARRLARGGFEQHGGAPWGPAGEWNDWLLEIALAQTPPDREAVLEHARWGLLYAHTGGRLDYYQVLRDQFETDTWPAFVDELLGELRERWASLELIHSIYVREGRWDELLASLRANLSLDRLNQYSQHPPRAYAEELIALYAGAIEEHLVHHVSREHYARACRGLVMVRELGGGREARELAAALRQCYPRRRALHDELRQVGLG